MIYSHTGNIKLCASDSFILRALEFYFNDLLRPFKEEFDLTGKKLTVQAYSCHMLESLIDIDIDNDACDAVVLITTRSCHRVLRGLFDYKGDVLFIDIDSANSVILQHLKNFLKNSSSVIQGATIDFHLAEEILQNSIVQSYFKGMRPSAISLRNKVSQREISKAKRQLMDVFSVRTTQELFFKRKLYSRSCSRYYPEW